MKKIIYSVSILLFVLIVNSFTAHAQTKLNYKYTSISNGDYTTAFELMNGTTSDLNDIVYAGQVLNNYIIMGNATHKSGYIMGQLKWEDPDYIIKEGNQNVRAISIIGNETVVFEVNICGIKTEQTNLVKKQASVADVKKKVFTSYDNFTKTITVKVNEDIRDVIPKASFWTSGGKSAIGKIEYFNITELPIGTHEIQWEFTPTDTSFETKSGMLTVNVIPSLNIEEEESIATTLTSNTIILNKEASYDINLNDKISGSKYTWETSDSRVVKVNSKNGVVTGLKNGRATITCTVTTPDNKTYDLTSDVIVGDDDNFPTLTDSELDLTIGEKYDIDVENFISKSKIKWTTSDKTVVKINTSTGVISCIKEGVANVYCTIINTKTKEVVVLKCEVTVNK